MQCLWRLSFLFLFFILSLTSLAASTSRTFQDSIEQQKKQGRRPKEWKYFRMKGCNSFINRTENIIDEPNVEGGGHYDIRYFKRLVDDTERLSILQNLMVSWLDWTDSAGIETWIAHGTLLGWWWNEKILPWDEDIDVQVLYPTLKSLGQSYNMTSHNFTFTYGEGYTAPEFLVHKEYLLDVNHFIKKRSKGRGDNVIDARWIDMDNGLYIDITGLSRSKERKNGRFYYHCKNNHEYKHGDIFPLLPTMFEDAPALVPRKFSDILIKEYQYPALWKENHADHHWNKTTSTWEKDLSDKPPGNYTVKQPLSPLKLYRKIHPAPGFWPSVWRFFSYWF